MSEDLYRLLERTPAGRVPAHQGPLLLREQEGLLGAAIDVVVLKIMAIVILI